jgi:RNA polymerase sigma-70 factor (ECF subfamily)
MDATHAKLSFDTVYAENSSLMRRLLARRGVPTADLDDVQQEAFVVVHRLLPSFEGRSSLATWLHSVAWRVAATYHRRARADTEISSGAVDAVERPGSVLGVGAARMHASLAGIDATHRDVLALHEVGGFTVSQLSELTGNARATIRDRIERGRNALGRRLWCEVSDVDAREWLERIAPQLTERRKAPSCVLPRDIVCDQSVISTLDDVVLVVWGGPVTPRAMEALMEVLIAMADAKEGFRYWSIVESMSTPPSRESRQMMAWAAGTLGPKVKAAAWSVESSALMGLVAPIVNASFFLGGVPINMRFFDSPLRASSWLGQYAERDDSAQLLTHSEAMRRRVDLDRGD